MRILLILCFLISNSAFSFSDGEIKSLMVNYSEIMSGQKTNLEEVFSPHFLQENGGKDSYLKKVLTLKNEKSFKINPNLISWKKGLRRPIAFVKVTGMKSQFIVIEDNKKLKIDGTLSDQD